MDASFYSMEVTEADRRRRQITNAARALAVFALIAGLFTVGVWTARWSGSALLGLVAANLAFVFVAAFFPVNRPSARSLRVS
jgi:fatty acid desaturase